MANGILGGGLMAPDQEQALTKRWNYLGAGLILLAFAGPGLATLAGWGSAFSVGADFARTLGSLFVLALIAWLVTRKKSDLAKAKARVIVGIVLCVVVGNNIARMAKEEDVAKAFVHEALAFQAQHREKFENLDKRFQEVTVAQYLTAEALISPSGVTAGKAALERFRSLLQERNLLLQTYLSESVALISRVPAGETRAGAESSFGSARETVEKMYKTLDRVQGEQANAIGAILDWAEANNGKLAVHRGELVFSSAEQQQELQALVARLQAAEHEVNAAVDEAQQTEAVMTENRDRLKEEVGEFLAK